MKPIAIKPAYLDRESVASFVSLSVNSLERLIASGVFPKPRQLTAQRVGWLVREVEEWAESRPVSANLPVANSGLRHADTSASSRSAQSASQ
jgi:prophage regulatory protein